MYEKSRYQRSYKARSLHQMTSCKSLNSIIKSPFTGKRRPTRAPVKAVTLKSVEWPRRQEFQTGVVLAKTSPITAERRDPATSHQHSKTWWWKLPVVWNSPSSAHRSCISNNCCSNNPRWPPRKSALPYTQWEEKQLLAALYSLKWNRARSLRTKC